MGYQALLFCPDEKLARVVTQVFSELDFAIDSVNEPFAAVKKLMAQRYDAVVVDCDNEQNTSLLFKSARNSSLNQGSLAIALVEGQAGVAKAYRIGANLVLTKPINVEQTKGTLRVARGLLRKGAESTTAVPSTGAAKTTRVAPAPVPRPASPAQPANPVAGTTANAAAKIPETPIPAIAEEGPTPLPAIAASAKGDNEPMMASATVSQSDMPIVEKQPEKPFSPIGLTEDRRKEERVRPVVAAPFSGGLSNPPGAAAAPAPAKEIVAQPEQSAPAPAKETVREKKQETPAELPEFGLAARAEQSSSGISDGPTFAALGVEDSSTAGGSKKILIGVVALVLVVALAYFGWTKFGQSHTTAISPTSQQPMPSATETSPQSTTPAQAAPISSTAPASTVTAERASTPTTERASKPSAAQPSKASAPDSQQQITLNSEPEVKKSSDAPIHVKPAAPASKTQPQPEEAAAQLPNPLGVNAGSDTNLSGILSSPNAETPTLARVKLSQGVSQGLLIKRVAPKYPQAALSTHVEGIVQIEATINKEGLVTNPKVLKGDRILAAAALEAVRQWRYKPYYLDGAPVEVETEITINFKAN